MRIVSVVALVPMLCTSLLMGQAAVAAQSDPGTLTIKARAQLVVLDVVVTDKHGAVVHDLKQSDFAVKEQGKPQTVKTFEEHRTAGAGAAGRMAAQPVLQPGTFTNVTATPAGAALTVVLVDTLNTAIVDQVYVRQQILKYLKTAPGDRSIAIFGLASKLYMLQGFTTDPALLRAAVDKTRGKGSALLDDSAGLGNSDTAISTQISGNAGSLAGGSYVSNLASFEADDAAFKAQLRSEYTLNAMSGLARFLADLPGRKNLIWFSGSFPINLLPASGDAAGIVPGDSFAGSASFQKQFQETTNLLARGRVAVFPVNARGVQTTASNSAANGNPGKMAATSFSTITTGPVEDFATSTFGEHQTMEQMAQDTGGRAFVNTNGLAEAIQSVVQDGGQYYTLAYTPTDGRSNGEYRKIEVKLSDDALEKGLKLAYRKGYFAEKPDARDSALRTVRADGAPHLDDALLRGALAHGMPNASQFLYKVRILPATGKDESKLSTDTVTGLPGYATPKGPYRNYTLDFVAPSRETTFATGVDGQHHGAVQFITVVYGDDGRPVAMGTKTLNADVNDEQLLKFQKSLLAVHQEISVPIRGNYSIRTAIYDQVGNKLGSAETTVAAIRDLAPAQDGPGTAK